MPTTSKPCSTSSAAVTELSTPPDMATTIRQSRGGFGRSSGLWADVSGDMGRQYKHSPASRNGAVGAGPQRFIMLRVVDGRLTVRPSSSSLMMIWQPRREVWVRPKVRFRMFFLFLVPPFKFLYHSGALITFQVELATRPSQVPFISMACLLVVLITARPGGASTSWR